MARSGTGLLKLTALAGACGVRGGPVLQPSAPIRVVEKTRDPPLVEAAQGPADPGQATPNTAVARSTGPSA